MEESIQEALFIRAGLPYTRHAIARQKLTVGFIGGSITEARVEYNWPEFVARWLMHRYPDVRLFVENAAIGGTGSDLGLFRAQRDLVERGCDLIFVEYAVNDEPVATDIRMKSREGLLRKLLSQCQADVVLVYTFMHEMFNDMNEGKTPSGIAELEQLAQRYQLNAVWMGLHAFRRYQGGVLRYDQWLPDNLHPRELGSSCYAETVIALLEHLLQQETEEAKPYVLPSPVDPHHWQDAALLDLSTATYTGPWLAYRSHSLVWADRIYATTVAGSGLRIDFTGRGIYLITNFGQKSADYTVSIDGLPFAPSGQDYPDWCSDIGWMRAQQLAYPLTEGKHALELKVVMPAEHRPTALRFDLIGIGTVP